jgi:hypothetical protein
MDQRRSNKISLFQESAKHQDNCDRTKTVETESFDHQNGSFKSWKSD